MYPDSPYGSDSNDSDNDDERSLTRQEIVAIDEYARNSNTNSYYDINPIRISNRAGQNQESNITSERVNSARHASNMSHSHVNHNINRSSQTQNNTSVTRAAATQNANTTDAVVSASTNTESQIADNSNTLSTQQLQTFMIDQMTKVQEQNDILKQKIETLEKEQESYYIDSAKRLETGFKDINKVITDMSELKKLFKEVVGIMSGERLRFLDHSEENAVEPATRVLATPFTTANSGTPNSAFERRQEARHMYDRDNSILNNSARITIKQESDGTEGFLPSLSRRYNNYRSDYNGRSTSSLNTTIREGSNQRYDEVIHRTYLMEDENNLQAIIEAQRNGERELENAIRVDQWRDYKINTAVQNVYEVAKEYWEGFPGKPSLIQLERKFGSSWRRKSGERTLFAKRKCIITKIENVLQDPKKYNLPENLTRNQAIKVIENIRLGNNNFKGNVCLLSLSQLYEYFSKKKDILNDYALTVKKRGIPRRSILQRQREKSLSETGAENGTSVNRSRSAGFQQDLRTFSAESQTPVQNSPMGDQQAGTPMRPHQDVLTTTTAVHPLAFSEPTGPSGSMTSGFSQPTGPSVLTMFGFSQPTGSSGPVTTGFTEPTGPSGSIPTRPTHPTGSSNTIPATGSQSADSTDDNAIRSYATATRRSFEELLF